MHQGDMARLLSIAQITKFSDKDKGLCLVVCFFGHYDDAVDQSLYLVL